MPAPKDPQKRKEWIEKMSRARKGRKLSEETKEKIRKRFKGRIITWGNKISKSLMGHPPYYVSPEARKRAGAKISAKMRGRKLSEEHKKKLSIAHIGLPRKLRGKTISCSTCGESVYKCPRNLKRGGERKFCNFECFGKFFKGFHLSPNSEFSKEKHPPNYKGGVSRENGYKRIQGHKKRAEEREIGGSFTLADWNRLKKKHNNTCAFCRKKEPFPEQSYKWLTVDHIIPVSKWKKWKESHQDVDYQGNEIKNIQPSCLSCNSRKNNKIVAAKGIFYDAG